MIVADVLLVAHSIQAPKSSLFAFHKDIQCFKKELVFFSYLSSSISFQMIP